MAQIYVNSGMVKPKSINIYNSSTQFWEKQKVGFVRVNGSWIPFIQYIKMVYDNGKMSIPLSQGYVLRRGTLGFNNNHIAMAASSTSDDDGRIVMKSNNRVNVTDFNILNIELEVSSGGTNGRIYYGLSKDEPIVRDFTKNAISQLPSASIRAVFPLNISRLIGDYYLFVDTSSSIGQYASTKIYKIWFE